MGSMGVHTPRQTFYPDPSYWAAAFANANPHQRKLADPNPVGLIGYVMSLTPLACDLMGWRPHANEADGSASIGAYFFFGGMLMTVTGLAEFFIGDTFATVVYASYGAFWLMLGATLVPGFGASHNYEIAQGNPGAPLSALENEGFLNAWDLTHVALFFGLTMTFGFLAGADWQLASGRESLGQGLTVAGGAWGLLATLPGWYMFVSILGEALEWPVRLPLGDLSHCFHPKKQKLDPLPPPPPPPPAQPAAPSRPPSHFPGPGQQSHQPHHGGAKGGGAADAGQRSSYHHNPGAQVRVSASSPPMSTHGGMREIGMGPTQFQGSHPGQRASVI
ncbi:MAG: hypothetical protein M1831_001227 [Alyxoria varia]|nr:MAG: hypothetical protein M1831_001227 [Alyxoria varia]